MKIAFFHHSLILGSGIDTDVYELARRVGKVHDTTVVTFRSDYDALEPAMLRVLRTSVVPPGAIGFYGPLDPLAWAEARRILRKQDVVNVHPRAVIEQISKRRGYLLNISSLSAITHGAMMGPYTAAKAGVEALSDALRMETAPSGAAVGCAYFGFLDTDLVRAAFAQPSAQALTDQLPGFIRNPAPLSKAIDAIERGIERRSARVWAPRWIGPMLLLRGLLQPLSERQTLKDPALLAEAVEQAAVSNESLQQDPLLGVAAQALDPRSTGEPRGARGG